MPFGPADEGWPTYFIHPDICLDCGACAPESLMEIDSRKARSAASGGEAALDQEDREAM